LFFNSPYCSFPAPWTQTINTEIRASAGYTINFWWKALEGTKIAARQSSWKDDPETMKRIIFFSKMAPLEVLAEVMLSTNWRVYVQMYGSCADTEQDNMDLGGGDYEIGKWYHTALTFGGVNANGKRGMWVFDGSTGGFDFADWQWCRDETMDFIQGMQLPGGILMSPIEVTAAALSPKAIQESYYDRGISYCAASSLRSRNGFKNTG